MAPNRKIYALKRIKLQGRDAEAATGFIDEITLLQALKGKPNIIQLIDAEVRSDSWGFCEERLRVYGNADADVYCEDLYHRAHRVGRSNRVGFCGYC